MSADDKDLTNDINNLLFKGDFAIGKYKAPKNKVAKEILVQQVSFDLFIYFLASCKKQINPEKDKNLINNFF